MLRSLRYPIPSAFGRLLTTSAAVSVPVVAARKPFKAEVKAGETYFWCSCGLSKNQPFCDGSHKRTTLKPIKFTAEEDGTQFFCLCKHSKTKPICDGSHAKLPKTGSQEKGNVLASVDDDPLNAESTVEEPTLSAVKELARLGEKIGHHGPMGSMGVPRTTLPEWNDIQILVSQMASKPLLDDAPVDTKLVIGPRARKPLVLDIPIFVSDMSFGALSQESKIAMARGAELSGTGICAGEGGMLEEEREENSRYLYELASAKFGWELNLCKRVQAFHFKGGQGAKTGTGGHLPAAKVTEKIASVRKLDVGMDAISPSTFPDLITAADFKAVADEVREVSGGIPIGFKLSANHVEADIAFALEASADYIILDGRGGGTGAAPLLFRDNISVPTIPAIARARRYLDKVNATHCTLIATGGLRLPEDFVKAMCLGADGVAIANSAMQSIGCIAARMCDTNLCPVGIATQKENLRAKLNVDKSAMQLENFFRGSTQLMKVLARACGHNSTNKFNMNDLTTWKKDMADLTGIHFAGDSRHP